MRSRGSTLLALMLAAGLGGLFAERAAFAQAPQPAQDELAFNGEVLTRGPVHEAFAEVAVSNPQAGLLVTKRPPDPIEEVPPEEQPEGDGYIWIPGYWAWSEDLNDFLWVSGVWRLPPPDSRWIPGYWAEAQGGFQWVSGTWASAEEEEMVYLPPPPETLEQGPSSPPPSEEHTWVSGTWLWQDRYVWRPGYWIVPQQGWIWIPARYCWSPYGYVFANGYWDYPLENRGMMFAPVYWSQDFYSQPNFFYRPRVVINPIGLIANLFARPRYNHYYFGDYYARDYVDRGFVPWFGLGGRRGHYDPLYNYYNWHNGRRNPNWAAETRRYYDERVRNPGSRPPRTFVQQQEAFGDRRGDFTQNNVIAASLTDLTRDRGNRALPFQLQRVTDERRDQIRGSVSQFRAFQRERSQLEARGGREGRPAVGKAGAESPRRLRLPQSPLVAQRGEDLDRSRTPDRRPGAADGRPGTIGKDQAERKDGQQAKDRPAPRDDRDVARPGMRPPPRPDQERIGGRDPAGKDRPDVGRPGVSKDRPDRPATEKGRPMEKGPGERPQAPKDRPGAGKGRPSVEKSDQPGLPKGLPQRPDRGAEKGQGGRPPMPKDRPDRPDRGAGKGSDKQQAEPGPRTLPDVPERPGTPKILPERPDRPQRPDLPGRPGTPDRPESRPRVPGIPGPDGRPDGRRPDGERPDAGRSRPMPTPPVPNQSVPSVPKNRSDIRPDRPNIPQAPRPDAGRGGSENRTRPDLNIPQRPSAAPQRPSVPTPPAVQPRSQSPAPQRPNIQTPPQARPAPPQARPAPPQARPAPPQARPAPPQARPAPPQARPAPPQARPTPPQARPTPPPQAQPTPPAARPSPPAAQSPARPQVRPNPPSARPQAPAAPRGGSGSRVVPKIAPNQPAARPAPRGPSQAGPKAIASPNRSNAPARPERGQRKEK